jgi:hypothetical protein
MLLNPFKEQFNFPSVFIELSYFGGFKVKIVCKKNKCLSAFIIIEFYSANFSG